MATYTLLTSPFPCQPTLRIARSGTRSSTLILQATRASFTSHPSTINIKSLQTPSSNVRSLTSRAKSTSIFDEDNRKKFYIFGGKGGAGKTTSAASLAVKLADHGHPTILVSFDPTHSLSDCFDQDLTTVTCVEGLKSPVFALEAKPEGLKVMIKDFGNRLGFGKLIEQLFTESEFEKLFTSSHSVYKAIEISAIWNVMLWLDSPECSGLDMRVVFDTSIMDGEVLNLFCNPQMMDATMLFSDTITTMTDMLRESLKDTKRVGEIIRGSTEYAITTIPTVMAVKEAARTYDILKKEKVHVRRLIVNQILSSMKTKDELRARRMIQNDPELSSLEVIEAPLVHLEMRGISALKIMGDMIWK